MEMIGLHLILIHSLAGLVGADSVMDLSEEPEVQPFSFGSRVRAGLFAGVACHVTAGSQPLRFAWQKDDADLPDDVEVLTSSSSSILSIASVAPHHMGAYTCVVDNEYGSSSHTTVLKPESEFSRCQRMTSECFVAAAPSFTTEPSDAAGDERSELRVECRADGHPKPKIKWLRFGSSNTGFSRSTSQSLSLNPNVLTIYPLSIGDGGEYVCEAENSVDRISKRISIVVRPAEKRRRKFL